MKLKFILGTCLVLLSVCKVFAQPEADVNEYIERYKELAIAEQLRSGVPAAITLAQGIHESSAGKSELATKGNNHFGIKCKSTWTGETMLHDDDAKQECFRKYTSAEQSYIDHSDFLKASNRYHFLFDLDKTDYAGWASGLKRAGYATNPQYVKRLTDLVEKYNLQQYTYQGISQSNTQPREIVPNSDKEVVRNLTQIDDPSTYYKGLKGFWAKKGETLLPKALEKNIRYAKLLALNDLNDEPLPCDMFIFTEKKRRVGTEEFHTVKEGETMLLISQKEAMPLATLYQFNNLQAGQEPAIGERLALQYRAYETPKTTQQFLKPLEQNTVNTPVIAKTETVQVKKEIPREEVKPKDIVINEPVVTPQPKEENTTPTQSTVETNTTMNEPASTKIEESTTKVIETETATFPSSTKEVNTSPSTETNTSFTTQPVRTEPQVVQSTSSEIIDPEKARKMEEVLNTKRLDGTEPPVSTSQPPVKQMVINESPFDNRNTTPPVQHTTKQVSNESPFDSRPTTVTNTQPIAEAAPTPIPEPVQIKRTYNEPNVSDSVKSLKMKFDQFVYAAPPPRKMEAPKKVETPIQKPTTDAKKPDAKTPVTAVKKEDKKVEVKKPEEKKPEVKKENVQVTKTGIKRDAKAIAESKEKEVNSAAKKKLDAKKEADDKKKEAADKKKQDSKKGKKQNEDDKKKGSDKKKSGKEEAKKKADDKSKVDSKKKPVKKK